MAQQFSEREREFLKFQKGRGVDAKTAFGKLSVARDRGLFGVQETTVEATPQGVAVQETAAVEAPRKRGVATQIATGLGKGIFSSIEGGTQLASKGLRAITPQFGRDKDRPHPTLPKSITEPEGGIEKAAFATEQVGEFLVPGAAPLKGAKAVRAVGKIPKAIKALRTAGTAGLEAGAITSVQEGEVGKESAKAAAFGAAAPAVIGALTKPLKKAGEFVGGLTVPTTPTEFGKDMLRNLAIGKTIQEDVGFALTKSKLLKKIQSKATPLVNKVNTVIDDFVSANPGDKYKVKDILNGVEEAVVADSKTLGLAPHQVESIRPRIQKELAEIAKQYKGGLDLNDVQRIKKELAVEKLYGGAVDKTLKAENAAILESAKKFRNVVDTKVPEVKALNKALSPLLEASKRIKKKPSFRSGLFYDAVVGSSYAGNPLDAVRDPVQYLKNFMVGAIGRRALSSTASKTAFSTATNNLDKLGKNPAFIQALRKFYSDSSKGQNQR